MSDLGRLVVSLAANTAEFSADLGKAAHEADKQMKSISDAVDKAGNLMRASFLAAVGTASVLTKAAINAADANQKMAQSAGMATDTFTQLAYAADLSGVETEAFGAAMVKLSKNMADAAINTGAADAAFKALGINVKDAGGNLRGADEVMADIADRFKGMEDGAGKTALAVALFGKAGAAMIPMLNEGSAGILAMREEAEALGVSLDSQAGKAAERFNDNLTRLNAVQRGMANHIMEALLPAFNDLTDGMVESAKQSEVFNNAGKAAVVVFQTMAVLAANAAFVVEGVGREIGAIAAQLGALAEGNLDGFHEIAEAVKADGVAAREQLELYERRVMAMTEVARTSYYDLGQQMKAAAPVLPDIKAEEDARRKTAAAIKEQQQAAKALADEITRYNKEVDDAQQAQTDKTAESEQARHEAAVQGLDQLKQQLMDERELVDEWKAEQLARAQAAREEEIITAEEHAGRMSSIEEAYQARVSELDERGWDEREKFARMSMQNQAKTIFSELASITAGVAQNNKALFEINKVAGIANAIINAYEGISLTMAKYPYPLNIAMAAAHGLAAFAQVKSIAGAQFGSGGAAPSIAGSTAAPPVSPVQSGAPGQLGGGQTTIVQLSGHDSYSDKSVRHLLKRIVEVSDKGGKVVLV